MAGFFGPKGVLFTHRGSQATLPGPPFVERMCTKRNSGAPLAVIANATAGQSFVGTDATSRES